MVSPIDFFSAPPPKKKKKKNWARQRTHPRSAGGQGQAQARGAKGVGFKRHRPVFRVGVF